MKKIRAYSDHLVRMFLVLFSCAVAAQDWQGTVITDPSITARCEELADKRNKKVLNKQKLTALLARNKRLQKMAPSTKLTILDRLQTNQKRIERELELSKLKITSMEEDIIRKGCPGITL